MIMCNRPNWEEIEQEFDEGLLALYKKYKEHTEDIMEDGIKEDKDTVSYFVLDAENRIYDLLKIKKVEIKCETCDFATYKQFGVYCELAGKPITSDKDYSEHCQKIKNVPQTYKFKDEEDDFGTYEINIDRKTLVGLLEKYKKDAEEQGYNVTDFLDGLEKEGYVVKPIKIDEHIYF